MESFGEMEGRLIFSSLSAVNLRGLPCSMRQAGGDHCAHVTDGHTEAPRCTANTPKHRAWVSPELCFFTAPAGTQAHGEEEEETGAGWQVLGMLLRNPEHCPGDVICLPVGTGLASPNALAPSVGLALIVLPTPGHSPTSPAFPA